MDINREPFTRLLADILSRQTDDDQGLAVDEQRLRKALTAGPALTIAEKNRLLSSPADRAVYFRIKREITADIELQWYRLGLHAELAVKAAAGSDNEIRYQSANGPFSVTLFKQDTPDMPWLVLIKLDRAMRDTLHPMNIVRLVDSGGLEWTRGRPDTRGELSFGWFDLDITPDRRLLDHTLKLDLL